MRKLNLEVFSNTDIQNTLTILELANRVNLTLPAVQKILKEKVHDQINPQDTIEAQKLHKGNYNLPPILESKPCPQCKKPAHEKIIGTDKILACKACRYSEYVGDVTDEIKAFSVIQRKALSPMKKKVEVIAESSDILSVSKSKPCKKL